VSQVCRYPFAQLEVRIDIERPHRHHLGLVLEPDDDAGSDAEVVRDVGAGVGELGAEPVGLDCANSEMVREAKVNASACLKREAVIGRERSLRRGEDAIAPMRFTDQSLPEKAILPDGVAQL
jgi:hypothetical protein